MAQIPTKLRSLLFSTAWPCHQGAKAQSHTTSLWEVRKYSFGERLTRPSSLSPRPSPEPTPPRLYWPQAEITGGAVAGRSSKLEKDWDRTDQPTEPLSRSSSQSGVHRASQCSVLYGRLVHHDQPSELQMEWEMPKGVSSRIRVVR